MEVATKGQFARGWTPRWGQRLCFAYESVCQEQKRKQEPSSSFFLAAFYFFTALIQLEACRQAAAMRDVDNPETEQGRSRVKNNNSSNKKQTKQQLDQRATSTGSGQEDRLLVLESIAD